MKQDPKKNSGYYYVKTPCMPDVKRVYCDMGEGRGNFYLFHGDLDTPTPLNIESALLGDVCEMYGLEPVKITGKEIFKSVVRYLNEIKAVTLTSYGVPLLYQPDQEGAGSEEDKKKYYDILASGATTDNQESRFDMVKDFISAEDEEKLGAPNNYLMLSRNRTRLTPTKFEKRLITGMVCSPNRGLDTPKKDNYITARCDDSFSTLPPELRKPTNGKIKILCPTNCQKSLVKVYGNSKFSLSSSMCKAA